MSDAAIQIPFPTPFPTRLPTPAARTVGEREAVVIELSSRRPADRGRRDDAVERARRAHPSAHVVGAGRRPHRVFGSGSRVHSPDD